MALPQACKHGHPQWALPLVVAALLCFAVDLVAGACPCVMEIFVPVNGQPLHFERTIKAGQCCSFVWKYPDASHWIIDKSACNADLECGKAKYLDSSDQFWPHTYSYTFKAAGKYDWICAIHPIMSGRITVTPSGGGGGGVKKSPPPKRRRPKRPIKGKQQAKPKVVKKQQAKPKVVKKQQAKPKVVTKRGGSKQRPRAPRRRFSPTPKPKL